MITIDTAAAARTHILAVIDNIGREEVLVRHNNTINNSIDDDGDVWVANPQTGHWLNEDKLIAFATFLDQ